MYSGDEFYDDDVTSGLLDFPATDDRPLVGPCEYRFRVGDGSRCQASPLHSIHHGQADGPDEAHDYQSSAVASRP